MQRQTNIGVLGLGTYLPDEVRTNGWWPENTVDAWIAKRAAAPAAPPLRFGETLSPGALRVIGAMAELKDDPFQGTRERRVIAGEDEASDMEREAAKRAIVNAGIDPKEIDLVLCNSSIPDQLVTNNGCLLHEQLGLSPSCFTMGTEAACNAFMMQLSLAESMIASGQARRALLIQSCSVTRLLDPSEEHSPWFGDGASAAVVGPVRPGRGVLSRVHKTDGSFHRTIVAGVRNQRWHDGGKILLYSADPAGARRSFLGIADRAREVTGEALEAAGLQTSEVNFYAPHQPTRWFRPVTQEYAGLQSARSIETFEWAASLFSVNIPLALSIGEREGLLSEDDVVLMFAGGAA